MPEEIEDLQIVVKAKDILKKEDFVKSFESITQMVVKALTKLYADVDSLKATYATLLTNFENRHDTTLKDLRKQVDGLFVGEKVEGMSKQHLEKMRSVDEALGRLEDKMSKIRDGYTPKKGIDYNDGRTPKKGVDYFDGLLDEKALEELKKELKEYADTKTRTVIRSGPNANAVQFADLSSQCDGAKKTFNTPKYRHALMLISTQFPVLYRPTVDFTLGNGQIIMTDAVVAPAADQTLIFLYIK